MSAKKSGGSAGRQRAKDVAMAAAMKAQGIERNSGKCPLCNKAIGLGALYNHIVTCKRN